jgi:ABC-type uncharacterized transport system substrate-binding protein
MRQSTLGSRCDETGDISFEFDIFHEFPRRKLTGDGHAHRVEMHMPCHRGPRRIRVRDSGNVTGFVVTEGSLGSKWLELLKEIAPRVARVAILFNPATAPYAEIYLNHLKATGASFGVETIVAPVRDRSELESVVAAQAREPNGGLIVMPDSFTDAHRVEITSLAARYRLPAVYFHHSFAVLGGLLSYGVDLTDNFRRAATYADRILKGAKPTELPEFATHYSHCRHVRAEQQIA